MLYFDIILILFLNLLSFLKQLFFLKIYKEARGMTQGTKGHCLKSEVFTETLLAEEAKVGSYRRQNTASS